MLDHDILVPRSRVAPYVFTKLELQPYVFSSLLSHPASTGRVININNIIEIPHIVTHFASMQQQPTTLFCSILSCVLSIVYNALVVNGLTVKNNYQIIKVDDNSQFWSPQRAVNCLKTNHLLVVYENFH